MIRLLAGDSWSRGGAAYLAPAVLSATSRIQQSLRARETRAVWDEDRDRTAKEVGRSASLRSLDHLAPTSSGARRTARAVPTTSRFRACGASRRSGLSRRKIHLPETGLKGLSLLCAGLVV